MKWKFWEAKTETKGPRPEMLKLPRPKDIPETVGRYLVVELGKNPDWVWNLKSVVRSRPDGKDRYDVRVFSMSTAAHANVTVKDYTSLDGHPEVILYEGWYEINPSRWRSMRWCLCPGLRREDNNTCNRHGKPDLPRYFFALQTRLISDHDPGLGGREA